MKQSVLSLVKVTAKKRLFPGMVESGNIDLTHRPKVYNKDGTVSTLLSMSIGEKNKQGESVETLIPRVVKGKILTPEQAIAHYKKTGQHLGKFKSIKDANAYASAIHQGMGSGESKLMEMMKSYSETRKKR